MAKSGGFLDMKLSELPGYVIQKANQSFLKESFGTWVKNYNAKYIQTGSIRPLFDVFLVIGLIGYAVNYPTEIRHLRHKEEQERLKRAGAGAGADAKGHH